MKKKKWTIPGIIAGVLIIGALYLFMQYVNSTALFADLETETPGYLPLSEFTLRDGDDIDKLKNNPKRLFHYDTYYSVYSYNGEGMQTSKGITGGCTFEEFVKVYGDYIADTINVYEPDYEGEKDDAYYDSHYFYGITANDFRKEYTTEELIEMKAYVGVDFSACVKGKEIYYSQADWYRVYDETYDSLWPRSGIFNPKTQTYRLSFDFSAVDGQLVLTSIDSTRYAY